MSIETAAQEKRIRSQGNWVVVAMFGFGILASGFLWVYWKMHVGPFAPLQQLLEEKYPDSKPRVEGGQRKMRASFPKILRVTMKVDFDPSIESEKRDSFVREVERFIYENFDDVMQDFELSHFEKFELHLFLPKPEETIIKWSHELSVEELIGQFQTAS